MLIFVCFVCSFVYLFICSFICLFIYLFIHDIYKIAVPQLSAVVTRENTPSKVCLSQIATHLSGWKMDESRILRSRRLLIGTNTSHTTPGWTTKRRRCTAELPGVRGVQTKQINRGTLNSTYRWDKQVLRRNRETTWQVDRQTHRQTDRQIDRCKQTNRRPLSDIQNYGLSKTDKGTQTDR